MSATLLSPPRLSRAAFPSNRSGAHLVPTPAAGRREFRIGLLGCGTVGACFADVLKRDRARLAAENGIDFTIAKILVRRPEQPRAFAPQLLTGSFEDVLAAKPDVVIELLGGLEPAASHIRRALQAGIPVVTANKTVIARSGPALRALARERGVTLAYEAAVCAAVPILSVLEQLRGDRIRSIHGILNGSTNYILTRMSTQPLSLQSALVEAKQLGLIEPDPAADLTGRDAAEKLAILARAAGFDGIDYGSIDIAGIEHITADDILAARRQGCTIKLVAALERHASASGREEISLRVGPMLVPRSHRLASVDHARNAIIIEADLSGPLTVEGAGAGPRPTSSALIGDLLRIARLVRGGGIHSESGHAERDEDDSAKAGPAFGTSAGAAPGPGECPSLPRRHYVRVLVQSGLRSPQEIIDAFHESGVSIKAIDLKGGTAQLTTLPARSDDVRAAVSKISNAAGGGLIAPFLDAPPPQAHDLRESALALAIPDTQHHEIAMQRRLTA